MALDLLAHGLAVLISREEVMDTEQQLPQL